MLMKYIPNIVLVLLVLAVCGLVLLAPPTRAAPVQAQADTPLVRDLTIGMSAQGRPITAVQVGSGERKLVIVGDTHGGPEANTFWLTQQLIEHFRAAPGEVPPDVRLYLIPTINPDGLALDSRFDSYGVDLNRNMNTNLDACPENDWRTTVNGAYGIVSDTGGPYPDSQRESRIVRSFLLDASGAIFLHSNAGLVFPAYCEHLPSIHMAQVYAGAAGYVYQRYWSNYMITGGMHDWAASLGIAAITPELLSATESEFAQNLAGVRAVLAQTETLLPLPAQRVENDMPVPAVIWRYWKAHGGEPVFGLPLEPARTRPDGVIEQTFSRMRLELHPDQADTALLVQPVPLRKTQLPPKQQSNYTMLPEPAAATDEAGIVAQPVPPYAPLVAFNKTDYTLSEAFLQFWRRNGGLDVFGYPISEEFEMRTADGQRRIVQYFEHAIFAYYPEDGSVRPEPLGWQALLVAGVQQPWLSPQVR